MPMSLEQLNTVFTETLSPITNIQNTDFTAATPADVSATTITSTATAKTVTAGTIGGISVSPVDTVTYTQISTTDEINNETLNRTAETLKISINEKLTNFTAGLSTTLNGLRTDTANAFTTLATDMNLKLSNLKDEQDTQVGLINTTITGLTTQINTDLAAIRTAEAQQTADMAAKMNQLAGEMLANVNKVKSIADNAQEKIAALDDVYGTDADIAGKVTNVNDFINTLRETDLDFVSALDGTIDEVNAMKRIKSKEVVVSAGNGIYSFVTLSEGFGEFLNASDYVIDVEVIGNFKAQVAVENKTKDGFDLRVTSNGVHFVPQPVDCSVTPVKVSITVTYLKRDPLTFNVDTLNNSFLSGGTGTDSNGVGAMVLSAATANLAIAGTKDINALGSTGTISAVSSDTGVATVVVKGTVITVTGVAAGTATVAVSDASITRTIAVTVS